MHANVLTTQKPPHEEIQLKITHRRDGHHIRNETDLKKRKKESKQQANLPLPLLENGRLKVEPMRMRPVCRVYIHQRLWLLNPLLVMDQVLKRRSIPTLTLAIVRICSIAGKGGMLTSKIMPKILDPSMPKHSLGVIINKNQEGIWSAPVTRLLFWAIRLAVAYKFWLWCCNNSQKGPKSYCFRIKTHQNL